MKSLCFARELGKTAQFKSLEGLNAGRKQIEGDLPLNKLIIYSVVTLVYMALTVLIFFIPSGPAYNSRENYYFLIFSVEVFLVDLPPGTLQIIFLKGNGPKC